MSSKLSESQGSSWDVRKSASALSQGLKRCERAYNIARRSGGCGGFPGKWKRHGRVRAAIKQSETPGSRIAHRQGRGEQANGCPSRAHQMG